METGDDDVKPWDEGVKTKNLDRLELVSLPFINISGLPESPPPPLPLPRQSVPD